MNAKRVYEETRDIGHYYVEDHGAGVFGIFFKGNRQRKYRYVATAGILAGEVIPSASIKRRINWHVEHVAKYGAN